MSENKFQEFPKAMYLDGEYMEVADKAAQKEAEADGWTDWHTDQARMKADEPEAPAPVVPAKRTRAPAAPK